jgi:hypothetical protein
MDPDLLVEDKIEDGVMLVRQLVRDQLGVSVSFWVKITEDGMWHLYIATPAMNAARSHEAYRIAYAALDKIPECSLRPTDIQLISDTDPMARDATALRDRYPSRELKRYHGKRLGKRETVELCIYPRLFPLEVRSLSDGRWQVLISEFDDQWVDCDSEDDARAIAAARVLEYEASARLKSGPEFVAELERTADVMERYRMGFGSRRLKRFAQIIQQEAAAQPA